MGKTSKRSTKRPSRKSAGRATPASPRKSLKKATNLTVDRDALARGEQYGRRHGTSLSQLVTGFLYALPAEAPAAVRELAPAVRRLYGVGRGSRADRETYRAHLSEKFGGR